MEKIYNQKIIRLDKNIGAQYSGIFIIIDGTLFIKQTQNPDVEMHMDLFRDILKLHQELSKYRFYPYYMFPRGSIIASGDGNWIILNKPLEFSNKQTTKLLEDFGQTNKQIEIIDGEHYSLFFIHYQIKSNKWTNEEIEDEIEFASSFYNEQVKLY